jgi:hypothetical protein
MEQVEKSTLEKIFEADTARAIRTNSKSSLVLMHFSDLGRNTDLVETVLRSYEKSTDGFRLMENTYALTFSMHDESAYEIAKELRASLSVNLIGTHCHLKLSCLAFDPEKPADKTEREFSDYFSETFDNLKKEGDITIVYLPQIPVLAEDCN